MSVNILVDFKENGIDKNEPHIVLLTDDVFLAGQIIKQQLEKRGCEVESLTVVDGNWTLQQLQGMANYGTNLDKVNSRIIYLSANAIRYIQRLHSDPAEMERLNKELKDRMKRA